MEKCFTIFSLLAIKKESLSRVFKKIFEEENKINLFTGFYHVQISK